MRAVGLVGIVLLGIIALAVMTRASHRKLEIDLRERGLRPLEPTPSTTAQSEPQSAVRDSTTPPAGGAAPWPGSTGPPLRGPARPL